MAMLLAEQREPAAIEIDSGNMQLPTVEMHEVASVEMDSSNNLET